MRHILFIKRIRESHIFTHHQWSFCQERWHDSGMICSHQEFKVRIHHTSLKRRHSQAQGIIKDAECVEQLVSRNVQKNFDQESLFITLQRWIHWCWRARQWKLWSKCDNLRRKKLHWRDQCNHNSHWSGCISQSKWGKVKRACCTPHKTKEWDHCTERERCWTASRIIHILSPIFSTYENPQRYWTAVTGMVWPQKMKDDRFKCSSNLKQLKRAWNIHCWDDGWIILFSTKRSLFKWTHSKREWTWTACKMSLWTWKHAHCWSGFIHWIQWVHRLFTRWACLRRMRAWNQVSEWCEAFQDDHWWYWKESWLRVCLASSNESLGDKKKMVGFMFFQS